MMRALQGATAESCWESVSSSVPCPVCGAEAGCQIHAEDAFVVCTQVPSDWPLTTGGWLHQYTVEGRARRESSGIYAAYDVNGSRKALASRSSSPCLIAGK